MTFRAESFLKDFLKDEIGRNIAIQSLNQCTLLMWSAFEVLASDLFVRLINMRPQLASTLIRNENTKNLYRQKDITQSLANYDYDVSGHMGDILIEQARLDSLPTIKDVYRVLLGSGSSGLLTILDRKEFWYLYKARNVIVHRASIVDEQFRCDTGVTIQVGNKFRVTADEFDKFLVMVAEAGVAMTMAASNAVV